MNSKVLIYLKENYERLNTNFGINLLVLGNLKKLNIKEVILDGNSK